MTRKRFIKLCMAKGIPRNTAILEATKCRLQGYSYSHYYRYIIPYITASCRCNKLQNALAEVGKSAVLLANKFKQLIACCEVQENDGHAENTANQ